MKQNELEEFSLSCSDAPTSEEVNNTLKFTAHETEEAGKKYYTLHKKKADGNQIQKNLLVITQEKLEFFIPKVKEKIKK